MGTMDTDERPRGRIKRFFLSPLIGLHSLLGKIVGGSKQSAEDAILEMVDAGSEKGLIEDTSAEIITNAFEFDDLEVSDVMTHRVNVVGVRADAKLDDIIYIALDEGFSRLPVYDGNLDNIIGIIIVKDLLSLVGESDLSEFSLNSFVREAVFIPESGSCTGVFKLLKEKKAGMAVVIDEHGGTAGIVTMEDLIEEIMGSIQDEYDDDESEFKKIGEKNGNAKYEIDGEADPEEALALFGYELPDNHEYETLAGFVTDLLGFIPDRAKLEEGQTPHVDYKDLRFVAVGMGDNCISRVIVYRLERQERGQ